MTQGNGAKAAKRNSSFDPVVFFLRLEQIYKCSISRAPGRGLRSCRDIFLDRNESLISPVFREENG